MCNNSSHAHKASLHVCMQPGQGQALPQRTMIGGGEESRASATVTQSQLYVHGSRAGIRRKSHAPPLDKYDEENDPIPDDQEEGPAPVKIRHVFEGLFHSSNHDHAQ